ncbi:MAG: DUF503 domain-containing protein [Actinobacteria bacterium]|nr:DUF503 domain-containing protein [Actinomycetota bacterium]
MDLRLPGAHSLKEKRAQITPIVEGARRRHRVAAAEVGAQDAHHRAVLGFATVSGSARHAGEVLDAVERFVWSFPEIEVLGSERTWAEDA